MTKQEARAIVGKFLTNEVEFSSKEGIASLIDAHLVLGYPLPQPLGDTLSRKIMESLPPGYTAIVEPYLGSVRVSVVKDDHLRMWKNRPPEEHD